MSLPHSSVQGQVVRNNNAPRGGTKLVFVSTAAQVDRQQVTTDADGKFRVTLASGGWLMYVDDADSRPAFHSRINLADNESRQLMVVSK